MSPSHFKSSSDMNHMVQSSEGATDVTIKPPHKIFFFFFKCQFVFVIEIKHSQCLTPLGHPEIPCLNSNYSTAFTEGPKNADLQSFSSPIVVNVLKGLGVVDGKDTEEALSCPHVLIPHGAVLLLTCSVQDVQQTCLSVDHYLLSVGVLKEEEVRKRSE